MVPGQLAEQGLSFRKLLQYVLKEEYLQVIWVYGMMSRHTSIRRLPIFIISQNCVPGIQLAHAGRKASAHLGWEKEGSKLIEEGGWKTYAPSAVAFSEKYTEPNEMSIDDIEKAKEDFRLAAIRSILAGYKIIELHFAHGYLVHEFLSPLSNFRKDNYGGSFENRCRLAIRNNKDCT